jgi:hypothetical protein
MGSMKMFMVMIMVMAMVGLSTAKLHHLFVGNLGLPASIHALEFDDEMLVLRKTKTIKADGSSPWITLSVCLSFIPTNNKLNLFSTINAISTLPNSANPQLPRTAFYHPILYDSMCQ